MKSALLVIDVQQSFMHRPYWSEAGLEGFRHRLQMLIDRFQAAGQPVVQIFHVDSTDAADPFSFESGHIETLPGLNIQPTAVFHKAVHSAMFGTNPAGQSLHEWLRAQGIDHLVVTGIRTEQCCETTTRHASDLGYTVTYAIDATLTFPMVAESGRVYSAEEIAERTKLVLSGRFAQVVGAEAVAL